MTFFDKKTEVISVELTQYGKHLLSMGKFKPVYYEFFDNDIIYDSQYAGFSETRNDIQNRIKNETPYSKPQYVFSGIETNFEKLVKEKETLQQEMIRVGRPFSESQFLQRLFSIQQTNEKIYFNSSPLGTSNIDEKIPTFKIFAHSSTISSSQAVKNLETQFVRTPEITMNNVNYEAFVVTSDDVNDEEQDIDYSDIYPDGTRLALKKQSIILEIQEMNTKELGENFDIELFEVTSRNTSTGTQEVYNKLYFSGDQEDLKSVEYYFEINTDEEIEQDTLEKLKSSALSLRVIQDINK